MTSLTGTLLYLLPLAGIARAKMSPPRLEANINLLNEERRGTFERQLEAHISRTRHLSIAGQSDDVLKRFASPASALESLSESRPYQVDLIHSLNLVSSIPTLDITAPKLRNLELKGYDII